MASFGLQGNENQDALKAEEAGNGEQSSLVEGSKVRRSMATFPPKAVYRMKCKRTVHEGQDDLE